MQSKIYKVKTSKVRRDVIFLIFNNINYNPYNSNSDNILSEYLQIVFNTYFDYIIIPGNLIFDARLNSNELRELRKFLEIVKQICEHRNKKLYVIMGENDQIVRNNRYRIPIYNEKYHQMLSSILGNSFLTGNVIDTDENNISIAGTGFTPEYQFYINQTDLFSSYQVDGTFIHSIKSLEFPDKQSLNLIINNDSLKSLNISLLHRIPNYDNIDMILSSTLYTNRLQYFVDTKMQDKHSLNYHVPSLEYISGVHKIDYDKYVFIPNSAGLFKNHPSVSELHVKKLKL